VILQLSFHFPAPPSQTAEFVGNLNKKEEQLAHIPPTALHLLFIYPKKSKNVTNATAITL
jgi:hypothetical protein